MVKAADLVFDLERVSIKEYRSLFEDGQAVDEGDEIVARAAGITLEELQSVSQPEYRRIIKKFFDTAKAPLADPN